MRFHFWPIRKQKKNQIDEEIEAERRILDEQRRKSWEAENVPMCPKCWTRLPEDSKVCPRCGR